MFTGDRRKQKLPVMGSEHRPTRRDKHACAMTVLPLETRRR